MNVIISKWENPDFFLYPYGDPDQPQNLIGSKLEQDTSSDFFHEVPSSSIYVILLTNIRKIDSHKIIPPWWW